MGLFASPNRAAVMNSLPPQDRGAGGGMNQTFQNSAQVLSIGIFFTLMIIGLRLEPAAHAGHRPAGARRLRGDRAQRVAHAAAGVDPVRGVPRLQPDPAPARPARARVAVGRTTTRCSPAARFFPHLISAPFRTGLHEAFLFAIVACLIAAAASLMRGGTYHHVEQPSGDTAADAVKAIPAKLSPETFDQRAGALARPTTAEEQHAR